jgi:pimeloyl-ACP methyl ester carboxylesterase
MSAKPTIVMVHGAFADASGWADVITALSGEGYQCYAPANPLRGIAPDSDYVRSFVATLDGPVVLAGHSYGGAVITNAGTGNPNVKALVYVAAYAPDEGETLSQVNDLGGTTTALGQHIVARPYPGAPEGDADGYIDPAHFHEVFCADLDADLAAVMAVSQRGVALSGLVTPSGVPAWKTVPCWYLVAGDDHAIPPAAERVMAQRMNAHTTEIASSHVAMISNPKVVVDLIQEAARQTSPAG